MKNVILYTDGACSGNPGVGGWGAVLIYGEHIKEISGYSKDTTNNRMEMFAVIQGLRQLNQPCNIKIYSDSAYVCNAFNQNWIENWKRNGWKNSSKSEVMNLDLWKMLMFELDKHKYEFIKVKGHADNEYNNRCDLLATSAIKNYKNNL